MYKYSESDAAAYAKLGIEGTTYEPGFAHAREALGDLASKSVLDYGCGAGRTAELLIDFGAARVIGVDHNDTMIAEARSRNLPNAEFALTDGVIPVPNNSMDAAMCAHVLVEVGTVEAMRQIFSEAFRVLNDTGVFVIITNNSAAIGKDFISFHYVERDGLESGQKIPIVIHGETPIEIDDYYWHESDYEQLLRSTGFSIADVSFPLAVGSGWLDESVVAPHVVITAIKDTRQ